MAESIAIWLLTTFGTANAAGAVVVSYAALQATTAIVAFVALTAANMAASKLLAPKLPSFSDISDNQQMVRSPIAARQIIYGRSRVSGVVVYISTTGSKNEYLHIVVAMAGHEVEEIGDVYFNDELALSGAGSGAASGRFASYATIYKHLGSTTQTADTDLISATSGLVNGKWTSNHRLRGIAYVYVRLVWNKDVWTGGIPNVSAVVKGKKVYDPRSGTTAYSTNAALCLRDYLTDSSLGMAMDSSEIDDNSVSAAANICDEQVQILPLSPTTYENRYEANGVLTTSATPDENIGKIVSSMGGLIAYSGGKIVMYASGYRVPTVSLNETHFVGTINVQTRTSARDRVNAVKGVYVSEENQWQPSDFPSITSSIYLAADNNIRYWRDVTLPMTTSPSCAQRLAVIELRRAREEITLTARFRLEAMQLRAGDTVMISNTKLGWTNKVFEVMEWSFVSDGSPPQLAIQMTMRETDSTVYSWTVADEVAVTDAPNTTLPNPFTLGSPTNLALVADGTTQLIQADGTALPRIKVSWSAPSEQFIQSGGTVGVEYKESTSTTYLTWSRVPGDQTTDYISSDVKIGLTYNVRVYGQSYFGVSTTYLSGTVNVQKDTTAPATPTGLVATVGTGKAVGLDWNDNTEPDFSEYGIWRSTDSVNYTKIAEARASAFVDVDVSLGTTYYYKVNAYDTVENVSGFSSVVSAVPTYISSGSVDPTAPSTPSAPTFVSESNYIASDGSSFAKVTVAAPALPTGARINQVLYRVSGSSSWLVASEVTASGNVTVDDLTPGVAYEFAIRAVSFSNVPSAVSSTLSRTAPTNTTAPTAPTASFISGEQAPPVSQGSIPMYAFGIAITASSSADIAYVEAKVVFTNSSGSSTYSWYAAGSLGLFSQAIDPNKTVNVFFYDVFGTTAGYAFVRLVSRSGAQSSWTSVGSIQSSPSYIKRPIGTVSQYNSNDVTVTGIKTGGGSSTRQINVVYSDSIVVTLTGGALTENFNVSLTNRGFSAKPDIGYAQCSNDANIVAAYDFDAAGNSSTNAVIRVTTLDGTNLPSGLARFSVEFTDYT